MKLAAIYAPFHRQNGTYHGLCVTTLVENWLEKERERIREGGGDEGVSEREREGERVGE